MKAALLTTTALERVPPPPARSLAEIMVDHKQRVFVSHPRNMGKTALADRLARSASTNQMPPPHPESAGRSLGFRHAIEIELANPFEDYERWRTSFLLRWAGYQ